MDRRQLLAQLILIVVGCGSENRRPDPLPPAGESPAEPARSNAASKSSLIRVREPTPYANVTSPLQIRGEARGFWFFEATFPLALLDADGNRIATGYAQAQTDWMTESFVPFAADLAFEPPKTPTGTLILEKQNASGLPEHADELRIPVCFRECSSNTAKRTAEP